MQASKCSFFKKMCPQKMHPCPQCLELALKILIFCYQWRNNFKNENYSTSNICCSLNSFFQLLIGPRNERPLSTFWYQSSDHFKNVDCSTPSLILAKFDLTFRLINDPEKVTPLYRWFKSNLNEIYPLTSSKY